MIDVTCRIFQKLVRDFFKNIYLHIKHVDKTSWQKLKKVILIIRVHTQLHIHSHASKNRWTFESFDNADNSKRFRFKSKPHN